jgi:cytochrome c peroxidase
VKRTRKGRLLALVSLAASVACSRSPGPSEASRSEQDGVAKASVQGTAEPILPLRAAPAPHRSLADLGARLFHEPLLSQDGKIACASCHDLDNGGDDGQSRSIGVGGKLGAINAPTVFNAALNVAQFWDGRAETLEQQVEGPITHPLEMATDWQTIEQKLSARPEYVSAFTAALAASPSREGVKRAIAAFERTLITVGAPFDLWLDGDSNALTAEQRAGYELFKAAGCIACHQGQNAGGNMYQRLGLFGDYFEDRGDVTTADYGRFNVTGRELDRYVFRVPGLRNVELTAPYFHDGSAKTLTEAVQVMVKYQLGKELPGAEVSLLVEFLNSLTGRRKATLASSETGGAK